MDEGPDLVEKISIIYSLPGTPTSIVFEPEASPQHLKMESNTHRFKICKILGTNLAKIMIFLRRNLEIVKNNY